MKYTLEVDNLWVSGWGDGFVYRSPLLGACYRAWQLLWWLALRGDRSGLSFPYQEAHRKVSALSGFCFVSGLTSRG